MRNYVAWPLLRVFVFFPNRIKACIVGFDLCAPLAGEGAVLHHLRGGGDTLGLLVQILDEAVHVPCHVRSLALLR